jgi:hypothetical protein
MTESNILPNNGEAILIDDHGAEFDWPDITRWLIDTIPWQVETARIFGREILFLARAAGRASSGQVYIAMP